MRKFYIFLLGIFTLRLLSLIPSILDEDEAWFITSAANLHLPFDFFTKAIDNKPPGTVWYFWIVQNLFHTGLDPRFARFGFILITFLTAFLIYKIATHLNKKSAWIASISFLLASALPFPKILATTTEGLMLPFICAQILLLLPIDEENPIWTQSKSAIAGVLFCFTLLMKQTGIVFILPVYYLFFQRKKWTPVFIFTISCTIPFIFLVYHLGLSDFWYWNYTYPKNVLEKVRTDLFSLWSHFGVNILILAIFLWPLVTATKRWIQENFIKGFYKKKENTLLTLWIISAVISLLISKGLFFHYFLLLLPPICLLMTDSKPQWIWLGSCYTVICLLSTLSGIQTFFGVDLHYYQKLGEIVQTHTNPDDKIFIWGGNAIAHITSKRPSMEKFITTRFVAPPYNTPDLEKEFKAQFLKEKPEMLIDLHERGDNRFNYPLSVYPWLTAELQNAYSTFQTPAVPWAVFYIRTHQTEQILTKKPFSLQPLAFDFLYQELYQRVKLSPLKFINHLIEIESCLRLWEGLRGIAENHNASVNDLQFLTLYQDLHETILLNSLTVQKTLEYRESILSLIKKYNLPLPMAIDSSFMWWVSFALVKLQPVANKS